MASPDLFAHDRSVLNRFLYADIGPQDGAGSLTVASLFGRGGHDPWAEAARLARLPAAAAVASLAAMIANTPANPCSLPEATATAERLLALLPGAGAGPGERRVRARGIPRRWPFSRLATGTMCLGLLVALVFAWLVLVDGWKPPGPGDDTRLVDPSAREAPR